MADKQPKHPILNTTVAAAVVAALVAGGVTWFTEDWKADAEFARIALSILSAETEEQNPVAREEAMKMLASVWPGGLDGSVQQGWLNGEPVIWNPVSGGSGGFGAGDNDGGSGPGSGGDGIGGVGTTILTPYSFRWPSNLERPPTCIASIVDPDDETYIICNHNPTR